MFPSRLRDPVSRRVLVVDDNADTTASLALLMTFWGHEVRTASDGRSALDIVALWEPELVVLDIAMPGMTGYEVARRMRRDLHLEYTWIITCSGYGREEDRQCAVEAGCDGHLVKPVEPEVLHNLLSFPIRIAPSFTL